MTFQFSLEIIEFSELLENKRKFNMANQFFRNGTAISTSVKKAQSAASKADFIHKIKIALKEVEETEYWLLLCKHSKNYPDCDNLLTPITRILKVLGKLISSSRK